MVKRINGQLVFSYSCSDIKLKKTRKKRYLVSLLCILIGIFLLPKLAFLSSVTSERLIELTNQERKKVSISILTANQLLTKAAYEKADAILEAQTFKHNIDGEKFSSWVKDAGYEYSYVGENLAIDFLTSEGILKAWKNSELHNKNLLNSRFTEIGIATKEGKFEDEDTIVVVQIFGEPIENITEGQVAGIDSGSLLKEKLAEDNLASVQIKKPESVLSEGNNTKVNFIAPLLSLSQNYAFINSNQINKLNTTPQQISINNFSGRNIYNEQIFYTVFSVCLILFIFSLFYIYALYSSRIKKLLYVNLHWKNVLYFLKHISLILLLLGKK